MHDYELFRLEIMPSKGSEVVSLKLFIPKLFFEAKTPVFMALFYRSFLFFRPRLRKCGRGVVNFVDRSLGRSWPIRGVAVTKTTIKMTSIPLGKGTR